MHGFALNIAPDISSFHDIVPCGIEGRGVTSLECLQRYPTMEEVATTVSHEFAQVFHHDKCTIHQRSYPSLNKLAPELFQTLPLHRR